jgi:hypothetical protein
MKITFKIQLIISFILLLQIISFSAVAQTKKEQIFYLNYQLDSLKQLVEIGQIKTRELEVQLISVNKNLNELLGELMITKRSLFKEDSLKIVFANELKQVTKKLLLSEGKSVEMNSIINSSKVEIDELKKELTKRDSLIGIYEKQSLLNKDTILLLNPAKPDIDKTKTKYSWHDLIPGIYLNKNCDLNRIYEWNSNSEFLRNGGPMNQAQMILSELIDYVYFDVLSSEQDNYEAIEGGLLYDGSKKIIILSTTSFMTDDGCIWIRKLNPPRSDTNYLNVIGKPIKIGDLEIAQYDFPEEMKLLDAKEACRALGKGWRLPTKTELNILYKSRKEIGGFANIYYWSSSEYDLNDTWIQNFNYGNQHYSSKYYYNMNNTYSVRAVRTF